MEVDPNTTVGQLLGAIPSSSVVFDKFAIRRSAADNKTLEAACTERGIRLEEFLQAIEDLDWSEQGQDPSAMNL